MTDRDDTKVKDKYFIPLEDEQELPIPATLSESEQFSLAELDSFTLKPKKLKYVKPLLIGLITLLGGLTIWELYSFIQALSEWHWSAALFAGGVGAVTLGLLANVLFQLRSHRRELLQITALRESAERHRNDTHFGKANVWIDALRTLYQEKPQAALLENALANLPDYSNDGEVVQHVSDNFFSQLDKAAYQKITEYSQQTGVLIALSPLALLDLILALWRNVKMIDEIGQIYGVRPSKLGRIQLFKELLNSMALASATELMADYWTDFSSASLSNVLSTRLAQGMGVGLYTARIGIRTMTLCRPLGFTQVEKPSVKALLPHLKEALLGKLKKSEDLTGL